MGTEYTQKRFGTIAVEKGFITVDQLVKAMNIQIIEDVEGQKHRPLGSILFDQGLITNAQIDEVLATLSKPWHAEECVAGEA